MKTVIINHAEQGSSLHRVFTEDQQAIVNDWLKKEGQMLIVTETEYKEKYSHSVIVKFQGRLFSIYSSFGDYRLGDGGALSSSKVVTDEIIDAFIADIK